RRRRPFFSAALEGDDHRQEITKDDSDPGQGHEAGKAIQVMEKLEFCHRESMTSFSSEGKRSFPRKSGEFSGFWTEKLPTKKPEEPVLPAPPRTGVEPDRVPE